VDAVPQGDQRRGPAEESARGRNQHRGYTQVADRLDIARRDLELAGRLAIGLEPPRTAGVLLGRAASAAAAAAGTAAAGGRGGHAEGGREIEQAGRDRF